jgi:hypothetical protein
MKLNTIKNVSVDEAFPHDVDHMPGPIIRDADMVTDNVRTKKKEEWDRAVKSINSKVHDDNSEFISNSKGTSVEADGVVWAKWDSAAGAGWFNSKGRKLKTYPVKEDAKKANLPSMVSTSDKFNLMCDGDNFILRSGGKRIAKIPHADWKHITDAVKNRTTVAVDGYSIHQKGDSYTLLNSSGEELAYLTAPEMDKLMADANKYLEMTKVVEEKSILKIAEMMDNPEKEYRDFDQWKKAVMAHHPKVASKLKWKGRVENKKSTISAEVSGEDRSYGVWDSDKGTGVVLGEEMKITELFDGEPDPGEYDQEGDMAKIQLRTIISAAQELHDALSEEDNLPEWVQSKLTIAEDYITTVRDYLKFK